MLTQTMNTVPQQLFTWALRQATWLQQRLQRAALRKAQTQAYQRFAKQHPQWANSLFDAYFLSHGAAPLIARAIDPTNRPAPYEFAVAWFEQCKAPDATARQADITDVVAAAADFLRCLEAELQPYQSILR